MNALKEIWRYPIKACTRQSLLSTEIHKGQVLPFDREWAVLNTQSPYEADLNEWVHCRNFARGVYDGILQCFDGEFFESSEALLWEGESFALNENIDQARFIEKLNKNLSNKSAKALVRLPKRGFGDSSKPVISLMNIRSHEAVEKALGTSLSRLRWRGNLWYEGHQPWEEWDFIGKSIIIGQVEFECIDVLERCKMINVNPQSGARDYELLDGLHQHFDHRNFGIKLIAKTTGNIQITDEVARLN